MSFVIRELQRPFVVINWQGANIAAWDDGVNTPWNDACENAANIGKIAEIVGEDNLTQETYNAEAIRRRDRDIESGLLELWEEK